MAKIQIIPTEYHQCPHCHRNIPDYAICSCEEISNNGYNQALEDVYSIIISDIEDEEKVLKIQELVFVKKGITNSESERV